MGVELRLRIVCDVDIVIARQQAKKLAVDVGLNGSAPTLVATAVSELARNMFVYARTGTIVLDVVNEGSRTGVRVRAEDEGPGSPNIEKAMMDGFSTGGSLGIGLPGTRRLMDTFAIESEVGKGTKVEAVKWLR